MRDHALPASDATCDAMIRLAAMHEHDALRWEARFQRMFASGLLRLRGTPGKEFALRIAPHQAAAADSVLRAYCAANVLPALRAGCTLGLDLAGLGSTTITRWWQLLEQLTGEGGVPFAQLMFSVNAGDIDYDRWSVRLSAADTMPRIAVRYGVGETARNSSAWGALVAGSYAEAAIQPVPVSALRPLSALHGVEKGQAVMPLTLLDAPAATAWLMLNVDARCLGHPAEVRRQLAVCLRFADNLIDALDWPQPALRLDALLNRRVAVQLTHVGDMLVTRGVRPTDALGYRWLQRWLRFIRGCFVHESRLLARRRGPFPGLCASDLFTSLSPRYAVADARRLMRNRVLRHRHLLALSPCALFPQAGSRERAADWLGILPAVACADAISMAGPDVRRRLSEQEWGQLLRLVAATAAHNPAAVRGTSHGY